MQKLLTLKPSDFFLFCLKVKSMLQCLKRKKKKSNKTTLYGSYVLFWRTLTFFRSEQSMISPFTVTKTSSSPRTNTKQAALPPPVVLIQCSEESGLLPAHVLVLWIALLWEELREADPILPTWSDPHARKWSFTEGGAHAGRTDSSVAQSCH